MDSKEIVQLHKVQKNPILIKKQLCLPNCLRCSEDFSFRFWFLFLRKKAHKMPPLCLKKYL